MNKRRSFQMFQKRKYFKSTQQQFSFSKVPQTTYLYIYKHHCPEIIVRFKSPNPKITGFDVETAQIAYFPFYDDLLPPLGQEQEQQRQREGLGEEYREMHREGYREMQREIHREGRREGEVKTTEGVKSQVEEIQFAYKGELILNKEAEIFVQFLKRQIGSLIEQSKRPQPKRKSLFTHPAPINLQISEIFQILINEWFAEPFINAIFLVTEKHLTTFGAFDHGFLKIEVLKTSQTNMQIPFYKSRTAKLREIKQFQNKHYYFQFESSVLYEQDDTDFTDLQKVGVLMPRPISVNQFFYEVLIYMFNEFEQEKERQKEKMKKHQERIRIKENLLQNFRKIGLETNLPEIRIVEDVVDEEPPIQTDPLDAMLNDIFGKKKKPNLEELKKESTISSFVQTSSLKPRRQSIIDSSPEKKQQNCEQPQEQQTKRKSSPRKNLKISQTNIKVIRSFTSQIIDQDFQPKPQRRFVTKPQFDQLIKLNQKITIKKQQKYLKSLEPNQTQHHHDSNFKLQKKKNLVFVGLKDKTNPPASLPKRPPVQNSHFVFDYFTIHHDTIILQKKQPPNPWAQLKGSPFQRQSHIQSRDLQLEPIEIPGLEDISVIEKRGRDRQSKIKAIEFMYENSDGQKEKRGNAADEGFEVSDLGDY